ncbi:hypothetical protein BC629DRAFT_1256263, partial [Irpex lacteus]
SSLPRARKPYVEEDIVPADFGSMDVVCHHCGALHWLEERVRSSRSRPEFGLCCHHGQVHLDASPPPPSALRELLTSDSLQAREFRDHIRQYNAALSFTSFNVNEQNVNTGPGPWIFKMGYQLYHCAGSLLPIEGQRPQYAQLLFYDPDEALDHRMHRNPNLCPDTMRLLQEIIFNSHRYTRIYKQAYEILEDEQADDMAVLLIADPTQDQRRYNLPTATEVAVIVPGDENTVPRDGRDIILRRRGGALQRINDTSPLYAPLHYVLLFPWGTKGWTYTLRLR